jgi:hypothetical protein
MAKGGGGNGMMRGPAGQQPPYQGGSFGAPTGQVPPMRGPVIPPQNIAGQMPVRQPGGNDWASSIKNALPGLISNANQQRMLNPIADPNMGAPAGGIPFNKAMPDFSGALAAARSGMGGMNPLAQQLQRTGANPAYQNTVMNKLRPTMASNQNVPPLQTTNPRQASAGRNPAMQRVAQLRKMHQYGF